MPIPPQKVEVELAGRNAGWTELVDVLTSMAVHGSYGIQGSGPTSRVAGSGSLSFGLRNSNPLGYYSPGHVNARVGWAVGIRVRFQVQDPLSSVWHVMFLGSISEIIPRAGRYAERSVIVTATDWFDDAARQNISALPVQVNLLSSDVFTLVANSVKRAPDVLSVGTGKSTFVHSLDTALDGKTPLLEELSKITRSEFGYCYQKGNGTVVFEPRFARVNNTDAATFDNSQDDLTVTHSVAEVISRIQVTTHPKKVDAAVVVLFLLSNVPTVAAGATILLNAPYTDPDQRAARVGAIGLVTPVVTTDYLGNAAADGSGANLTGSLTVTISDHGTAATIFVTNNSASLAYITKLQLRGQGVYDYDAVVSEVTDAGTADALGETSVDFDMPYQEDLAVGEAVADYIHGLFGALQRGVWSLGVAGLSELDTTTQLAYYVNLFTASVRYNGGNAAVLSSMLALDISDRIRIIEDASGVATSFYIQSVDYSFGADTLPTVTWGLTLADQITAWAVGLAGFSELDNTTRLSF